MLETELITPVISSFLNISVTHPVSGTHSHAGRWAVPWLDELVDADAGLVYADL